MLRELLETEKPSQAAAQVAKATGLDRKTLYARAMEIRGEMNAPNANGSVPTRKAAMRKARRRAWLGGAGLG